MRRDASSRLPPEPPPRPRPTRSPVDRLLAATAVALVVAGTFLGVSRHGQPVLPRARELFIPGGLILLVIAFRSRRREPIAAFWIGLVALALIGVGAHEAAHGPWTLLALPGTVLACLASLRAVVRGPRDPLFERARWASRFGVRSTPRGPVSTRMWLAFIALLLGVGAGLAVSGALPPRPTVDVQVVPVAFGGGTTFGAPPDLFGVAVRQAHCTNGATGFTIAVRGETFDLSCASSAGSQLHTVTLGLSAGHSYGVTIEAVQERAGRTPRTGTTRRLTLKIPDANSASWQANP
jgi:hypothetical protein